MSLTSSIHDLYEETYAVQCHYDSIHRRAEGSHEYATDLAYRLNEIKATIKDAVAGNPAFSNDVKRTAEVARRLHADYADLIEDELKAARQARQDRAELERSEQAIKTARARLASLTAMTNVEAARIGLEAAQFSMPRLNIRTR